jgi:flagellin
MANIGATTAFYKVETSLTRANTEVSKSMERLATGRANANAGDRSSYVAMADTFRLDYVGTKAGIKGASVVMGYLETGMRVLDSASSLVSRLQELAVLGANDTNTAQDGAAINAEAAAIAKEFDRLLTTAKYKGKALFNDTGAFQEKVSLGGRGAEMSFGMAAIRYYPPAAQAAVANADPNLARPAGLDIIDNTTKALVTNPYAAGQATNALTSKLESLQAVINTARVQAGSQYAAMESAINYTTDLTAQYELGFNTVNDVNFSMETAHLAKNQILQQAATAMLAQANQGQQGLLQLIS